MIVAFYNTVDCEIEKHNAICNNLNVAIKAARARVTRETGHDTLVRRINLHFNPETCECRLEIDNIGVLNSNYSDLKRFERDVYCVLF